MRLAQPTDAPRLAAIYNHYVTHTIVTFEEEPITAGVMARRMDGGLCWRVLEEDDDLLGYAYAVPWKERSAYRHTVETTIYLAPDQAGRGLGTRLYGALLKELQSRGFHTALGGIALPNPASVALHEKLGFRKVGELSQVGWKFGRWIDVGYWQRSLQENSPE